MERRPAQCRAAALAVDEGHYAHGDGENRRPRRGLDEAQRRAVNVLPVTAVGPSLDHRLALTVGLPSRPEVDVDVRVERAWDQLDPNGRVPSVSKVTSRFFERHRLICMTT